MSVIKKIKIVSVVLITFLMIRASSSVIYADTCANWCNCSQICVGGNCYEVCGCCDPGSGDCVKTEHGWVGDCVVCNPGFYVCNSATNCCPIGDGGEETCFPAGTGILMYEDSSQLLVSSSWQGGEGEEGEQGERATRNIEDVMVGDRVISQDEDGKRVVSMVTELDQPVRSHMCEINFANEETLQLTDEHPLYTQNGWRAINPENTYREVPGLPVTRLGVGDVVVRADGEVAEVESYACWSERQQTYNLILEGSVNTYFANGYLAHNKGADCPPGTHIECTITCKKPEDCRGDVREKGNCPAISLKFLCRECRCVADPCDDTLWSACVLPCGAENQTNDCGTVRSCGNPDCEVSGTVYYDPNNTCSTSVPENVGGGLSAVLRDTVYSGVVGVDGTYNIEAAPGVYNYLDLGGIPVGYSCSSGCVQGCPSATSVISPSVGNNFFLTNNKDAWWQVVGAGVYAGLSAGGVTISSELPFTTSRLVIPGTNDLAAVVRASGNVPDTGVGEISDENWSVMSSYRGKTMDYRYFASRMGVTPGTESDFSSGTIEEVEIAGLTQDFYYAEDTVDGEVSLGDVWTVTSGESYVIFVDGDLEINKDVTVESGGFLIFVVNGGVTVTTNVVSMQGMYVMDEVFMTETLDPVDDSQLAVEGMVVAWGGVSLGRDLGGVGNGLDPAEEFTYRVDLLINMPAKLKSFALNWQEVVPGTFD